jgi:CMP-N,N'-diacetyllegionaminic acid synthase
MIGNQKLLGIIPARGGSKGIPRKNVRLVKGKPLIAWTIEQANQSKFLDRVVLSSEDLEIMRIAAEYGCEVPFRRPPELAADHSPGIAPVLHALDNLLGYDYVVLLQPTSPLRSAEDIDNCISLCVERGAPACVSVTKCEEHPYLMFWRGQNLRLNPLFAEGSRLECRQQLPDVFRLNGAVYVARSDWLRETRTFVTPETIAYEMPLSRSMDIDTEADLQLIDC